MKHAGRHACRHLSSTSPAPLHHLSSTFPAPLQHLAPKIGRIYLRVAQNLLLCLHPGLHETCMQACKQAPLQHLSSTSPAPLQHLSSKRGLSKGAFLVGLGAPSWKKSAKYNGDSQPEIQIQTPATKLRNGCEPGPWRGVEER